ncbi:MAG: GTP 3',8-cyclase MoaA [Fimbriimonadaceae bacterium]
MEQLADSFGRKHSYLRISVTDRCNLRCRYCMPPDGLDWIPKSEVLTFEEIERLASLFVAMGVNKLRLTGGEPTVRKGIADLIKLLAAISPEVPVWMTTNGTTLESQARNYRRAGLTGLNVSLDSLQRDKYFSITRRDELPRVLRGINAAIDAGFEEVKVNIVVMAGVNDDEIHDFVSLAKDRPLHLRFIEFMPFNGNGWSDAQLFPYAAMRATIAERFDLERLPGDVSDVGKDFGIEGFKGKIGFVTSMTQPFCEGCNRIRLTAEGGLKTCLFARAERDLRTPMREGATDEELSRLVRSELSLKWRGHPPLDRLVLLPNKSMVAIGG